MIEIKNLYKSYGSLEVLKDISFKIEKGDIFGIMDKVEQVSQHCYVVSMV